MGWSFSNTVQEEASSRETDLPTFNITTVDYQLMRAQDSRRCKPSKLNSASVCIFPGVTSRT